MTRELKQKKTRSLKKLRKVKIRFKEDMRPRRSEKLENHFDQRDHY